MKNIFKKVALIIGATLLTFSLTACASKESKKDSDTVIVGLDNTFVPMGYLNENNELVGFDVDLANEVFKRIGYKVKFENIEWSLKEKTLNNKNIDVLWNGYTITEERKKVVDFSKPYLDNKQIIVTMKEASINNKADLQNQAVGTQISSSGQEAVEKDTEFVNSLKDKQVATYDTYDKALRDLEIGRIKAVVGDEVLLKYYIKNKGEDKYKILEENLGSEEYAVGFRKEDSELKSKVDKALDEIKADGTFDKIKQKWFN